MSRLVEAWTHDGRDEQRCLLCETTLTDDTQNSFNNVASTFSHVHIMCTVTLINSNWDKILLLMNVITDGQKLLMTKCREC